MVDESFERIESKLRRLLPDEVFQPAESRLFWIPVHYAVIALGTAAVVVSESLWLKGLASLFIGLSFAGLAFVAHEALHGALTKRRALRRLAGVLGFLPFCLSPRLWLAWHNRVHHGSANVPGKDPDALATLHDYLTSQQVRVSTNLQARTRGLFTLGIGFTIQSLQVLGTSVRYGLLNARKRRLAALEMGAMLAFWVALGVGLGFVNWLFFFGIPLLIGNTIVMMHIVTNHGLSPLTEKNDPLLTSLSVTVPRAFSYYTLDFGFHSEHHLVPNVSLRHGPIIRDKIRELAPDRYQSMPLSRALLRFFEQLRVYRDAQTLVDPWSGRTGTTIVPTKIETPPASTRPQATPPRSAPPTSQRPPSLRPART